MVSSRIGEDAEVVPTVRARVAFVNGEPFDMQKPEVRQQQGQIGREFAITYRPSLDDSETVVSGEWWKDVPDVPEVSVEEDMAGRLHVGPGDSITFDAQMPHRLWTIGKKPAEAIGVVYNRHGDNRAKTNSD